MVCGDRCDGCMVLIVVVASGGGTSPHHYQHKKATAKQQNEGSLWWSIVGWLVTAGHKQENEKQRQNKNLL